MNSAGFLIHKERERFNVSGQKFFEPPVFQYFINDRMFTAQLLYYLFIGNKLFGFGNPGFIVEFQSYKKNIAELLWGGNIKFCSGKCIYFFFKRNNILPEIYCNGFQIFKIQYNAVSFDCSQDIYERHLYGTGKIAQSLGINPWFKNIL